MVVEVVELVILDRPDRLVQVMVHLDHKVRLDQKVQQVIRARLD
jgi:hypothetical protein